MVIIIACIVYYISKLILKRLNFGTSKKRKIVALISSIILSPLIYLGIIYMMLFTISYYPSNDFDKIKWDTNKAERYKMSEDIIESEILIGKTKTEIIQLLGNDFYSYNNNHIAYELGFVPGLFNIDIDVLDIYFENEKVIKVSQHSS
ncbi:hypothetical protein DZC78_04915 [Olleya aquimaris]|uniref:Uncharacterized protein n=1 Tax=Olleya sediminilitoris TaxID=2795739 RepID=A0ABS1WJZ9_9FLAO|nr:hypothetical protein DZC78_04915 [Olleya aquimaris]MBL7559412.1 hypothetical protein [Olleya sediminilitoris]